MRTRASNLRLITLAATLASLVLLMSGVVSTPVDEAHAQSTAGTDFFLKIDGVDGESVDDKHRGEIEIESWSWGETNSSNATAGGGGTGKVHMRDFHFTMQASKASPKLFLLCAQGKIIPSATLTAETSDGQTYLTWELKDVIISSFKTATPAGSTRPTESISINFTKIIVTYTPQNPDGSQGAPVRAGYDVGANKKI